MRSTPCCSTCCPARGRRAARHGRGRVLEWGVGLCAPPMCHRRRGVRVAVGSDSQPWIVNSGGSVYRYIAATDSWTSFGTPGIASDIGVGAATR
jgi:hypothetical protein